MNALEHAIISGKVYYDNGIFKGEFNSKTSKILKDLGAKWLKLGWKLPPEKTPVQYLSAIAQGKFKNSRDIERLLKNLMGVDVNRLATKADVKKIYDKAIDNLNKGLDAQFKKIPTVQAQFDEFQLDHIKKTYSNNMDLHIKGFLNDEIRKVRERIQENVFKGVRYDNIVEELEDTYQISKRRATFIARQETRLLNSEMKVSKYQKAGVQKFIWHARHDDRVRHDHEILDGKIFRFDDPPIIDLKTGTRGYAGQYYGCRCFMEGVRE
jgi:SPP1 gp7 family putative phage head morphogenesis protein